MGPINRTSDTPSAHPSGLSSMQPNSAKISTSPTSPSSFPTSIPNELPSVSPSLQAVSFSSGPSIMGPINRTSDTPSAHPSGLSSMQPNSAESSTPTLPSLFPTSIQNELPSESPSLQAVSFSSKPSTVSPINQTTAPPSTSSVETASPSQSHFIDPNVKSKTWMYKSRSGRREGTATSICAKLRRNLCLEPIMRSGKHVKRRDTKYVNLQQNLVRE